MLDSRSSFHVTSDQSQLVAYKPVADGASVQIVEGTSCPITHQGSLSNSYFSVPGVSFVPQLFTNLLSVGQLADHNCFVEFDNSSCFIQDHRTGTVLGTGHRRSGSPSLYVLGTLHLPYISAHVSSAASSSSPSTSSFAKWHHRLGHLCGSHLSNLINKGCLGPTSTSLVSIVKVVSLGNRYNSHILLLIPMLLNLLILSILMYGALLLLLQRVVINIMLFSLMIILNILGFTS